MNNDSQSPDTSGPDKEYNSLLELDNLESLLEELEDRGATGNIAEADLPGDILDLAELLNVHSAEDVRSRIAKLHTQLDSEEFDE
jgi:hypothetical protein